MKRASFARRDRISRLTPPCIDCDRVGNSYPFFSSKVTAAGAMIGTTYDLRRRGALRPYVLASGGLVLTHDKFVSGTITRSNCDVGPCTIALGAALTPRNDRPVSTAAQVGAGLVYSWRWVAVLAEARYLAVDYANTRGLNGAVPVSLGLRF